MDTRATARARELHRTRCRAAARRSCSTQARSANCSIRSSACTSPWLARQGIVTQADDGMVVAKGTIDGQPAVVLGIDGGFQGGSMGEVSAAKIAGSLELAAEDNRNGIPTRAVILFETGGVRLQEANLGLAAIAEIHAAHRRLAALPAGDRHHGRPDRLLRRHVDRSRPVQLPDRARAKRASASTARRSSSRKRASPNSIRATVR